jgi:signal transduction histidine kinase
MIVKAEKKSNDEDKYSDTNPKSSYMTNCFALLTGMSHEMRTHMNSIVAFSFLIENSGYNDDEHEKFSFQILNSCEQLIGLFDSFLESAIIDSGNLKVDLKICKLNNILDEILLEFREVLMKEVQKDLVLISETHFPDLSEVYIDSDKVFKVIRILFQNALKNTKSGDIIIGCNLGDDIITFHVIDSGQGYYKSTEFLNTEDLNVSLKKFNDPSSAIYITLSKKIIQLLEGIVWIERNGLAGTGVYFSIPAKKIEISNISSNNYANKLLAI